MGYCLRRKTAAAQMRKSKGRGGREGLAKNNNAYRENSVLEAVSGVK